MLAILLFLPASIQLVHSFEVHEEIFCTSEVENHFHQKDLKCELCHLQAKSNALLPKEFLLFSSNETTINNNKNYQFLLNHQQLSFSLRGPPYFNFL